MVNSWRTVEEENEIQLERRGWRIERVGDLENERMKEKWRRRGRRKVGGLELESMRKN
jgi:hypothetical protein